MRIGIDVSQAAYDKTGVANYLSNFVQELVKDEKNQFILFFSSMRRAIDQDFESEMKRRKNVKIIKFRIPPSALDVLWNKMHIVPIELFIGKVDLFISSDWAEPPAKCKKATVIYDLIVYKYPNETDQKIVSVQKRKLSWVKKESDFIFCISKSTKKDVEDILGIESSKIHVIYPGL